MALPTATLGPFGPPSLQQRGQQRAQPRSQEFRPTMSSDQTRKIIDGYKSNPKRFAPSMVQSIENHANYHNIPFYSGEFSGAEAIKQFAQGLFSGFTTFNVGEAPDNEYEAIARSVGHLVGFAPGIVAKPLHKIPALSGWAAKLASVKSVPFMGAHFIRKKATEAFGPAMRTAIKGRADATGVAADFLTKYKGPAKHIAEGAFDLGIASGISAWQGGINSIMESTFHGAMAGGVFRTMGNAIKVGDPTANKLARGLAGSLFQGLQAEHRGATTPEKVYEYLLGAFFGYSEVPWYRAGSAKFMKKFNKKRVADAELDVTKDPELMGKEWSKLEPEIQDQWRKDMTKLGFQPDVGRAMGYELIEQLGYKDKYGNVTKDSWQKVREVMRRKIVEQGLPLDAYAQEVDAKPAKERVLERVGKIEERIIKDKEKINDLAEAFEKEEAKFKETGKKSAMYIYTSDKVAELSNAIIKNQELKDNLVKGIGKEVDVSKPLEVTDTDSDVGEMSSNIKVGKRSEYFADKWLKDLYKVEGVGPAVQKDLKLIVASRVHKELMKHVEHGKSPNTDKLAENLQKELGAPLSSEARGELRQWLNIENNHVKQRFLRASYSPDAKKGEKSFKWSTMDAMRPLTRAGNKKDNKEPMKVLEEIYLKESGGELDEKNGIFLTLDHISKKNESGHWKDNNLQAFRANNPEQYNIFMNDIIKDMNNKGFYLFGGRGDADRLHFVKYHPKTREMIKQSGMGKTMNRLIGPPGNRKESYKSALELFRTQNPNLSNKESRIMFDHAFMSNVLYDMGMQGYALTGANLSKMWGPKETTGFISNALDYNKRLQIYLTPAWPGSKEYARKEFAKDKIFKKYDGFRYSIIEDLSEVAKHDEKLLDFEARFYKEIVDGAVIGRDDVVNFNNKDSGHAPSGQNKAFIMSPDSNLGALLGKFMFHKAGPKLSEQMKKENKHYLIYTSSAKQLGKRKAGDYFISPKGKLSLTAEAETYTLDPSHIKYSYSVGQSDKMVKDNARLAKQWFNSLNSRTAHVPIPIDVINDVFSETISKSYKGETKWNDSLTDYLKTPTPKKLDDLVKNVEKIGINNLLEVVNSSEGSRFADAAYERLLRLNKEIALEDARENGVRESQAEEYSQELDLFDTVTKRIISRANKVAKEGDLKGASIYLHNWVRPYRLNVMRNYVMSSIAKPKIGNSAGARMRPYDKALMMDLDNVNKLLPELNKRDDIFFLDNRYKDMPLVTHLPGKWKKTTLGKLWDAYIGPDKAQFKGLEKEVDEILRAMVVRVPMDSVSGAHALKFKGFTGRDGHGILMHPRAMRALGGADLDGDEAFIYFGGKDAQNVGEGMKKSWKDAFEANKNEYVQYVSREKIDRFLPSEPLRYKYLTKKEYDNIGTSLDKSPFSKTRQRDLNKRSKDDFVGYIPDPKEAKINRPDSKGEPFIRTMKDLLTEGKSEFSKLSGKSQTWMYAPSVRREISEKVVDSRAMMGGIVSLTQNMKNAHDLISTAKNKIDEFTFKDWNKLMRVKTESKSNFTSRKGEFFYVPEYTVRVKARESKEWLDYARRLSASMTAFTADPMDTGGLKPFPEYFNHLHTAYFRMNVKKNARPGTKEKDKVIKSIKDADGFFSEFRPGKGQKSAHLKLLNGALGNFMKMNNALHGRNYFAGRMWQENEIRSRVDFIKDFEPEQLTNIVAKQAVMVKDSPRWSDNIFSKIDKTKLENMYTNMNKLAKDYKFLAGMMGRSTFTIPPSLFVKKVLDYKLMSSTMREALAQSETAFKEVMTGLGYTRNKKVSVRRQIKERQKVVKIKDGDAYEGYRTVTKTKWEKRRETAKEFESNMDRFDKTERLEILNDVFIKAQDFIVKDMHDMITLTQITDLYEANKDVLDMKTMGKVFKEVEKIKKQSYLARKERMDAEVFHENPELIQDPDVLDAYNYVIRRMIKSGDRRVGEASAELDQIQIDKKIREFKQGLKTNAEKQLYDILMLGTYNRAEMSNRSKANLEKAPELKHEFIMKGAKTSLTQLGYASTAIGDKAVDNVLRKYMDLSSKITPEKESAINKVIKASKDLEKVEIEVDGQDGKVKLFERNAPEKIVDTYIEDMSGYEGLTKGKLTPAQAKIVTELAENLKYYSKGVTLKLNEITRGILRKDMNVMDAQDWKALNNFFREKRKGTFLQRLFKEDTPDMKQRYWSLFPKTVSRAMMKYDIQFAKEKGFFKTKGGEWTKKAGWVRKPVWVLEGLQDWNGRIGQQAIALGENLQNELNSTLSFYTDAMPEGEKLRRIAVQKMQLGEMQRIMNAKSAPESEGGTSKTVKQKRAEADGYKDAYLKEIEGSTKNLKTAQPTGDAKIALQKKYNITHPNGKKERITGWDIVDKISKTYEAMNKRAHKQITGDPKALEPYKTGNFFVTSLGTKEPELDYAKFIRDMEARYQQGLDLPTDLGIDGVRQIARSMLIDLTPNLKIKEKLKKTAIVKTGKLDFRAYYPHIFGSASESKKYMEKALENIMKSKMPEDKKNVEMKKILLRTHNLTGDWIDPGQEMWDSFDRAATEVLQGKQKRQEFINWWDANQTMSSMNARNSHIPGYSIDKNVYDVYLRNIGNTYFNQINQMFSRSLIERFRQRGEELGWHKEKTGSYINAKGEKVQSTLLDNWLNFLKLYAQDAMGNPSVIPERIYSDPAMKLKGTPYYWWADNRIKKKLEGMKKVILGKNASKYPNLDKLMKEVDYSTLTRISNAEAKFELASLLAHPKASVANVFGGSAHTIQSAGLEYFKKGRNVPYLNNIFPKTFKSKEDVDAFVTKHGVIPEFILYQFGIDPGMRKAGVQNFIKDIGKKMSKSGELDKTTFKELSEKHNVSKGVIDIAAKFMSVPERMLRRDAFMAHYTRAYEMFDGAIKDPNHPFLIEIAKKGVKATQFLYSAPYRPAFARTALGKIMSRFQLWQWNAVRFRNDVAREAKIFGLAPGNPAYERFVRTMQIDMFVMAMGSAFAYSIFDTAMPAPYAWFQDTSDWLFGNEAERDRAFFGMWPKGLAPLQLVTPPIMRHPLSIAKSLYSNDWERFSKYHVYTMFPFGRMAKDLLAPNNLIDNPMGLVDKMTGFPLQSLGRESKKMRKGKGPWYPWAPYGVER